jgi:hypothetical protein
VTNTLKAILRIVGMLASLAAFGAGAVYFYRGDRINAALWLAIAAHIDVDRTALAFNAFRKAQEKNRG